MNILDACRDRNLFAPWFRDRSTWLAWFAFLAALFGLPMTPDQLVIYRECTGRTIPPPPGQQAEEAAIIVGRRGGKSLMTALIAIFLTCFRTYALGPGERGVFMIINPDRRQSRVVFRYILGLLHLVPMLARLIVREAESRNCEIPPPVEFTAQPGAGVIATVSTTLLGTSQKLPASDPSWEAGSDAAGSRIRENSGVDGLDARILTNSATCRVLVGSRRLMESHSVEIGDDASVALDELDAAGQMVLLVAVETVRSDRLQPVKGPAEAGHYEPASRPPFSVLDCSKLQRVTELTFRPWETALAEYVAVECRE